MAYNPGIVDRSGEIRAQGMLQGGAGLLGGFEKGMEELKRRKEEDKKIQASIKANDTVLNAILPIAGNISPDMARGVQDALLKLSDSNLSPAQRAAIGSSMTSAIGELMKMGIDKKKSDLEQARLDRVAQAQIEADRIRMLKDEEDRKVARLVGLGSMDPNKQLSQNLIKEGFTPEQIGKAQTELFKVYGKRGPGQTYNTIEEAQAAAQKLKAQPGTVAVIKAENGAYVVETVVQAPKTLPDPEEDLRWKQFGQTVEADKASGDNARKLLPAVNRVSALLEKGNVDTGFGTKVTNEMRSIGKAIGIPIDESKLRDTQEAEAYAGRFFLEYIQQTKGSISEKENAIFQSLGPELSKDTAVNKNLIKMVKDRLDLDQKVARLADGWRAKRISREQYEEERQKLLEKYDQRIDSLFPDGTANPMPPLDKAQQYFK